MKVICSCRSVGGKSIEDSSTSLYVDTSIFVDLHGPAPSSALGSSTDISEPLTLIVCVVLQLGMSLE